jgi:hypothetical protein
MQKVSRGIVIKYFKEALKIETTGNYCNLISNISRRMYEAKIIEGSQDRIKAHGYQVLSVDNKALGYLMTEICSSLLFNWIIIPEPAIPRYVIGDCYLVTEYGRQWAYSEDGPIPEDVEGVISFLKEKIPNVDEVIIQYVGEALRTFEGRFYFASAVMIGAASEKLVYLLAMALQKSICNVRTKENIEGLLKTRKLFDLYEETIKILKANCRRPSPIPYSVHEESIDTLGALINGFRLQRNDAVHPVTAGVSKEELRLLLLSFPHLCKKVYDFIGWLNTNTL